MISYTVKQKEKKEIRHKNKNKNNHQSAIRNFVRIYKSKATDN